MGVIVSGIRYQGRLLFKALSGFGGSTLEFITQAGSILTELDGVEINYPLVTNALPTEQLTYMVKAGQLPSGVTLDILTGVLKGTPGSVVDTTTYFFTVVAQKVGGVSTERTFSMTIQPNPQPEFVTAPTDERGNPIPMPEDGIEIIEFKPFEMFVNGTGLHPNLTYSVSSGTLPDGLTLDPATGKVSGTPTEIVSNYRRNVTIMATSGTKFTTTNLELQVLKNRAPAFQTATELGSALGGGYFAADIIASDADQESLTFSVSEGSILPGTLALNGNRLSGALPLALDGDVTSTFSLDVTDGHNVVTKEFEVVSLLNVAPVFTTSAVKTVLTGATQSVEVAAIDPNDVSAITLTVKGNNLPQGVTFDPVSKRINGTFSAAGSYSIVIEASNGELTTEQTITFHVEENLAPVWETASTLASIIAEQEASILLVANDPNGSPLTYSLVGGALPQGMQLQNGRLTGRVRQVAAPGVTSTFTVRASDGVLFTDREFTLYVDHNDSPIWNTQVSLGAAYEGTLFTSPPLSAYDVDGQPVRITPAQNGLPDEWTYDAATKVVSGIMPPVAKNSVTAFSMVAHDGSPGQGVGVTRRRFEITNLFNKLPVWTTQALPKAVERDTYLFYPVVANPGNTGFTFSLTSGELPAGVTLAANGTLSGTVAAHPQDTNYTFEITVTNEIGSVAKEFTLLVEHNEEPVWVTPEGALYTTLANNDVEIQLEATDANGTTLTYSAVTPLPTGLVLSQAGIITGKTQITQEDVTATFTVAVSDGVFSIEREFSITTLADSDPIWTTGADLGKILEGSNLNLTVTASDPERLPLTYSVVSGALPTGITLADNRLSGPAPEVTEDTIYTFGIEASDGVHTMAREFTLLVENNVAPVWNTAAGSVGSFKSGGDVTVDLDVVDPNGRPVTITLLSGTLPPRMSLNGSRLITVGVGGTETVDIDTTYEFTLRASDGRFNVDRAFSITLLANLAPVWVSEGLLFTGNEGEDFEIPLDYYDPENDTITFTQNGIPSGMTVENKVLKGSLGSVNQDTTSNFTLTITDGSTAVSRVFQIKTLFSTAPKWVTATNLGTNLREGRPFSVQLQTHSGPTAATYAAKGALPGSLQVSSTGLLYGNLPLIDVASQTLSVTITATNSFGTSERTFTIGVVNNAEPVWQTPAGPLYTDAENKPFTVQVHATDSDDASITYSLVSGDLSFATLNPVTGVISGTLPNVVGGDGVYPITIGVSDGSVRVDRTFVIRSQNLMEFNYADLSNVGSPLTAEMIVDGQIPGEWSSYNGAADRTITLNNTPTSAILPHSRDVPPLDWDDMFAAAATMPVSPASAINPTDITDNAVYVSTLKSSTTTSSPTTATMQYNEVSPNVIYIDTKKSSTTTTLSAQSATQNT